MSFLPERTELGNNLDILDIYGYYDHPCLFSCKNELGDIFLAIWSDSDNWLFAPVTEEKLKEKIEIRDFFLKAEKGFVYIRTVSSSKIEKIKCEEILDDWLPYPNEYL